MKNKDLFKDIFNKSPVGILFYDKKGKLMHFNQSALKIMGISKSEDILKINLFDNPVIVEKKNKLLKGESLNLKDI